MYNDMYGALQIQLLLCPQETKIDPFEDNIYIWVLASAWYI